MNRTAPSSPKAVTATGLPLIRVFQVQSMCGPVGAGHENIVDELVVGKGELLVEQPGGFLVLHGGRIGKLLDAVGGGDRHAAVVVAVERVVEDAVAGDEARFVAFAHPDVLAGIPAVP